MNTVDVRALFPGLHDKTYLNTATLNVGSVPAKDAYVNAAERWAAGRFDWTDAEKAGEDARATFAQIIGAHADEIAIVPAVSVAAGVVAANLPDAARGENIVVAGGEFSSNFFPWLMLRERGYDVRVVSAVGEGIPAEAYAEAADGGTRLLAASAVHSPNGYRTDIGALSTIAARSGARLFIDACQAAGSVPLDVVRDRVDYLAASSHKFLLGARGMGYLFVRRGLLEHTRPVFPGWKAGRKPLESFYGPSMDLSPTASKLDASLNWFAALAEQASMGIFKRFGIQAILDRNAQLSRRLHDAIADARPDLQLFPERHRSPIVSIPVADTATALTRLRDAGIVASPRAGRIRLSVHFYNIEDEIDRAAKELRTKN